METPFQTYRAQELGNIGYISTLKLKVRGTDGETKWLTISGNELEKIIAVLEPEDFAQATESEPDARENRTYGDLYA